MSKDYETIDGVKKNIIYNLDTIFDKGYDQGFKDGSKDKAAYCELNFNHGVNKGYEDGLNDAWECARKIWRMSAYERAGIFHAKNCILEHTASEAIQMIKEYEEKQKQVTRQSIIKSQLLDIINGQKNPVTVDEITEILEQVKETENDG